MKFAFQQKSLDKPPAQGSDGSFRRSKCGVSPDRRSDFSTSSSYTPSSRKLIRGLKDFARKLVDIESFSHFLGDWIGEKTCTDSCTDSTERMKQFKSPFPIDDLCKLDYALEGTLFQQLLRMPYSDHASDDLKEEYLALEDFLHAAVDGLWRTFWHKSGPLPLFVSCPRYPGSKFYTVEDAIARGKLGTLCGAALVTKNGTSDLARWDQLLLLALFKSNIAQGNELSSASICEALFYGFHILISRSLSKSDAVSNDPVFLLVLDSKVGGVVKFGGNLSKLELNSSSPYQSVARWIKLHAEINVSPVDRIWNKLGNPNWADLGSLQLLLATYHSIIQSKGPPRKSIDSLAADHSLRLQKRWIECRLAGDGNVSHHLRQGSYKGGEIVELDCSNDHRSLRKQPTRLEFKQGDVVFLEDMQGDVAGFRIHGTLADGSGLPYSAVSLENPGELLSIHVGAHPSRLEPSWEDMSLWYQVQRQTKVLNIMKQQGVSSKYLPVIVASGRILHSGPCLKQSPVGLCDHPWCGTPILVTDPVGDPLSTTIAQTGPMSAEEALRCCRDCLFALRIAASANIQHGDICPENIICVDTAQTQSLLYMPVSWGRAVLEDRDSAAMNLQFSSSHALQQGKLCPSSDVESLIYLLYFVCGGAMPQQDSIESALRWRERSWARRLLQKQLGEVSTLLKAFADYVDTLCGTPYPLDYDIWLKRLNSAVDGLDRGKLIGVAATRKLEDGAESSGVSGG